jgi:hypothetical protein
VKPHSGAHDYGQQPFLFFVSSILLCRRSSDFDVTVTAQGDVSVRVHIKLVKQRLDKGAPFENALVGMKETDNAVAVELHSDPQY